MTNEWLDKPTIIFAVMILVFPVLVFIGFQEVGMKYNIDISIMDSTTITVESASCIEHAKEIALQMVKQDYPDASITITDWESIDD